LDDELRMHVFVCVNERDSSNPRGCCSSKDSLEIMTKLKKRVNNLCADDVRVNKSGCLNMCENGVACVIYPQGIWYTIPNEDYAINEIAKFISGEEVATEYLMIKK
tara:strand:+ start:23 stop:340 length:318 start_codon:yes stop_codon:yes gene_type:complete